MDIFNVLSLIGGLALFLYGMNVMGDGLAKTAGGKLEKILEKLTSTPIKGVILGAAVTGVIQSSSATTVMVVGFVNSGIMKLTQAVGIIMGANIGTTVTSWILSLSGIQSDNFWIKMLKPSSFSPILAVIGIVFLLFTKSEKKHDIGTILLGFAVLMFGMETMSAAVKPLANVPEFTNILTMFSNPILGMLAGAVLTAVIQSSSASVGILQALCATGFVSYGVAIPIIMGQNIGTCVTALISSIGAKKNAKRAAFVHLYFNVIGTTVFMIVFYLVNGFMHFSFLGDATNAAGIAIVHSLFNVGATILLLPFGKVLVKLATLTVRDEKESEDIAEDKTLEMLDARFLEKPAFAVVQSVSVTKKMASLSRDALFKAMSLFENYDKKTAEDVVKLENKIDQYEDQLGTYLVKLSSKQLSLNDSQTVSIMLHVIGDFEINISKKAEDMHSKGLKFSYVASKELQVYGDALKEIMNMTVDVFTADNLDEAVRVEPLEEVIDRLNSKIKKNHVKRLQNGECTIDIGLILEDTITNYERVADHCSNVAVCMLQVREDEYGTHEYLDNVKHDDTQFKKLYQEYKEKYYLN